jgi:hypothetical protein
MNVYSSDLHVNTDINIRLKPFRNITLAEVSNNATQLLVTLTNSVDPLLTVTFSKANGHIVILSGIIYLIINTGQIMTAGFYNVSCTFIDANGLTHAVNLDPKRIRFI